MGIAVILTLNILACDLVHAKVPLAIISSSSNDNNGTIASVSTDGNLDATTLWTSNLENPEHETSTKAAIGASCVDGVFVAGQCLIFVDASPDLKLNWDDAKEDCEAKAYLLAGPVDPTGFDEYMESYAVEGSYVIWTAGKYSGSQWNWYNGNEYYYFDANFPWADGQPNNSSTNWFDDAVTWSNGNDKGFANENFSMENYYVCQVFSVPSVEPFPGIGEGIPIIVSGVENALDSLNVTWNEPTNNCGGDPIIGYSITYQEFWSNDATRVEVSAGTSSLILSGLQPCTRYTVDVAVRLENWEGSAATSTGSTYCQGCIPGSEFVGDQCLIFVTDRSVRTENWFTAKERCEYSNQTLAILEDPTAFDEYTSIHYPDLEFWIGGSDSDTEGTWLWDNGEPFPDDFPWAEGEPSNGSGMYGSEDCLVWSGNMTYWGRGFQDYYCGQAGPGMPAFLQYVCNAGGQPSNQESLGKTPEGLTESLRSNVDHLRNRLENRTSDPIFNLNEWAVSVILQLPPAAQATYQDELYKLVRELEEKYKHQPDVDSQQAGPSES